jgi:hypothetical protein
LQGDRSKTGTVNPDWYPALDLLRLKADYKTRETLCLDSNTTLLQPQQFSFREELNH